LKYFSDTMPSGHDSAVLLASTSGQAQPFKPIVDPVKPGVAPAPGAGSYQTFAGKSQHVHTDDTQIDDLEAAAAAHPLLRRRYSDINVLDAEAIADVSGHHWKHFVRKDFYSNLSVVTLPAIFTNAIWRGMNLAGIAVHVSPAMVIMLTTLYIAPVVWVTCSFIDMIRQLVLLRGRVDTYLATDGARSSIALGFKFFMGVLGWTVGYEVVAGTHMFYAGADTAFMGIVAHALGAGVGEFFGLLVACELVALSEFIITGHLHSAQPTAPIGIATKGLFEGIVWSVIGDLDLFTRLGGTLAAGIFDSVWLGFWAALAFSIMGIATSLAGFWFIHRRLHPSHRQGRH
jgi:hypothetical protein